MGIDVVLQDENCANISKVVHDSGGIIIHCLPDISDSSYCCVRFIDPYGDVIFNPHQATIMIAEWKRLKDSFVQNNAEVLWSDIFDLIIQCSNGVHIYLRFIGD